MKPKQTERLPLDIPEPRPSWQLSEKARHAGRHWLPIARRRLEEAQKKDQDGPHI
jgi:hypothetical protein